MLTPTTSDTGFITRLYLGVIGFFVRRCAPTLDRLYSHRLNLLQAELMGAVVLLEQTLRMLGIKPDNTSTFSQHHAAAKIRKESARLEKAIRSYLSLLERIISAENHAVKQASLDGEHP